MQINILNPVEQTFIFTAIFLAVVLLSVGKQQQEPVLGFSITGELKGLAILAIIFSHIGYFLSNDNRFLFPLSIGAGVGVNLFLFLSGYGLTTSALNSQSNILPTIYKRLSKLFLPLWIVLPVLFLADWFILGKIYDTETIIGNLLGFFLRADLFLDVDSPLWYFTWIFFYYIVFLLLPVKKFPLISAGIVFLVSVVFFRLNLSINNDVIKLYKLHTLAFPLGMLTAVILQIKDQGIIEQGLRFFQPLIKFKILIQGIKYIFLMILLGIFAYTAYHSAVGQGLVKEQGISLVTMFSLVLIFILKKINFRLFNLFGKYSYEIYLIHWPILSRYDLLFKNLPPFLATGIYLMLFLILGFSLQSMVEKITAFTKKGNI